MQFSVVGRGGDFYDLPPDDEAVLPRLLRPFAVTLADVTGVAIFFNVAKHILHL